MKCQHKRTDDELVILSDRRGEYAQRKYICLDCSFHWWGEPMRYAPDGRGNKDPRQKCKQGGK